MVKIILSGCNGKMGKVIAAGAKNREDCKIAAGVDLNPVEQIDFPVFRHIAEWTGSADVIIDFSHPSALSELLQYAKSHKTPIVIATTGLSKEQADAAREAAEEIPVFMSGNMSLGINLLIALVKKATAVLGGSFDIEIVEAHHNQKIDAPSGTALMLADAANEVMDNKLRYSFERQTIRQKRSKAEIGIHSVRGGTIVGEHEVIFAGHDEVIRLSHSAGSKDIFAEGALAAAVFLAGQKPGLYNMNDFIGKAISD